MRIVPTNRVQEYIGGDTVMLCPKLDFMFLEKISQEQTIHLINDEAKKTDIFKIISIGPGRYEFGTFIKSTCKPGDKVVIASVAIMEFDAKKFIIGKEREVIASVE